MTITGEMVTKMMNDGSGDGDGDGDECITYQLMNKQLQRTRTSRVLPPTSARVGKR